MKLLVALFTDKIYIILSVNQEALEFLKKRQIQFKFTISKFSSNSNGGPTKLPAKGGGQQQRPGKEEPLVGWRKEGASDHQQCWSQFLVGFIHPVR